MVYIKKIIRKIDSQKLLRSFFDDIEFIKEKKTTNFMTEASKVKNSKRIILGAGPITAHEVNENISEYSYNKLVNQYNELISKICQ